MSKYIQKTKTKTVAVYCVFTIHSKMYNVYNVLNSEYNPEHVNIAGSHKNGMLFA